MFQLQSMAKHGKISAEQVIYRGLALENADFLNATINF